jgi:hypothetical protein
VTTPFTLTVRPNSDRTISDARLEAVEHNENWRFATWSVEATGLVLVFLMLFVPTAYQPLKGGLLAFVLAVLAARALVEHRIALHPHVAIGCLIFVVVGIAFIFRGYLAGAPGALRTSTVYVIWPLVNVLLITGLAQEARLWRVARLLVWTAIAICLYCANYILWSAGWLPDVLYLAVDQGQRIGFYDGHVEFNLHSTASLLFLVPFVAAALFSWPRQAPVARVWLWLALVLGLATGLLSGRRAFQLVLVLGLLVALSLRLFLPRKLRGLQESGFRRSLLGAAVAGTIALIALQATYGLNLGVVWSTFKTGFQFAIDPAAQSRALQFDALIQGWLASPFFGSGHGASASSVIRSSTMPWAYELSYVALLYHTGLIGMLLYGLGVTWIYVQGLRIVRRGTSLAPLMVATLTGTTTFLIANATNPYLEKFDCLWTVFLPLALINASLLNGDGTAPSGQFHDGSRHAPIGPAYADNV